MKKNFTYFELNNACVLLCNNLVDVDIYSHESILKELESCQLSCQKEILENMNNGSPAECIDYLQEIQKEILRCCNPMSIKTTTSNNIWAYFNQYEGFIDVENYLQERWLNHVFRDLVSETAYKNIYSKKEPKKRREIGEIVYIGDGPNKIKSLLDDINTAGILVDFHHVFNAGIPINQIVDIKLRDFVSTAYKLDIDEKKTDVLRVILGSAIALWKELERKTRTIEYYFNSFSDIEDILKILRGRQIINQNDKWQEFSVQQKDGSYKTYTNKSSVFALIQALATKSYLNAEPNTTQIRSAFSHTFGIQLSDRSFRKTPLEHNEVLDFFYSIIPDR